MVTALLRTLSTSIRGLHQAAYLLAALTLASQVLALIRDRIFAHTFGAGQTLDLYYAAFRVPDLVFALIASLVSAYVLIPRLSKGSVAEHRKLLSHVTSFLFIAGGAICVVLFAVMPFLLSLLFPTLTGGAHASEFVWLARLLLLQPIILGISGILTSVTQVHRRFILFAISPILYNVGIIFGAIVFYPSFGLLGIGIGVVLGAIAHLAVHIPVVIAARVFPVPTIPSPAIVWSVVKDSVPRSLALSLGALTTLLLTSLAAKTTEGAVSVFTLASNLQAVPIALIGASYATAAFPVLSDQAGNNHMQAFRETLSAAGRHIIFWSSIAAVLTVVLRAHLVRTLLGTGAFDWDATRLTAALLAVLVVAIAAQGFILLASRAFYAARKSWMPFCIQVLGLIVSVGGAYGMLALANAHPDIRFFFEHMLRVDGVAGSSVLFIALGATLGQLCMFLFTLATLRQVAPKVAGSLMKPLFEGTGAAMVGAFVAYWFLSFSGNIAPLTTLGSVFAQGFGAGMVGLGVTALVLMQLGNREFSELIDALKRLTSRVLVPADTTLNDQTHS